MDKLIKKLKTPEKVQDFLDLIPFNFEMSQETYWSPKKALAENKMHCFEGALFACLCLRRYNIPNYLLDLKVKNLKKDSDHTLCIFKINKFWGAISKTNHGVLRFRDPIYKSPRELVMSYFHEYFLDSGEKTLESYSKPFDIWRKFGEDWVYEDGDLDKIAEALDRSPHLPFVPKVNKARVRKAGKIETKMASLEEWSKNGKKSIV
jgi:hypothetical protein